MSQTTFETKPCSAEEAQRGLRITIESLKSILNDLDKPDEIKDGYSPNMIVQMAIASLHIIHSDLQEQK